LSQPFDAEILRVEKQVNDPHNGSSEPGSESTSCTSIHRELRRGKMGHKATLRSREVSRKLVDVFPERAAVSWTLLDGLFGVQTEAEGLAQALSESSEARQRFADGIFGFLKQIGRSLKCSLEALIHSDGSLTTSSEV